MSNETASFIAASLGEAIRSGRVWPDVPGVPEDLRDLAHAARFAPPRQAAEAIEKRLLPLLPSAVRRALDALTADLYQCEEAGVAVWEAALAVSMQARARHLQKEAVARLQKEVKALEA